MPETVYPASADQLRSALESAAASHRAIELFGARSKHLMAGPIAAGETRISTSAMTRILKYEPRDLTISVEAGIRYSDLSRELARNGQMIPLAGPWSADGTMGGIVAANISESRRRGYGTARDLVIGMEFATLEGKLVRSGGMVVKNVAGLDMAKLMIGSFGTLAAIATLNFKLLPIPTASRTLLIEFETLAAALAGLAAIRTAGLNPIAADVANPVFVAGLNAQFGIRNFLLAVQFGGNQAVIDRSTRESTALCAATGTVRSLSTDDEQRFWTGVAAVTQRHLEKFQNGVTVRIHTPLSECGDAMATVETSGHAMAASGVVRAWFSRPDIASRWLSQCVQRGWKGVIETAGPGVDRSGLTLWPEPGTDFAIMKKIRNLFDPEGLLNRGRLYGHL
ncbi:MAG TPA: FAD-binding oxidoreductase [Bryobacteraceae bacterium]